MIDPRVADLLARIADVDVDAPALHDVLLRRLFPLGPGLLDEPVRLVDLLERWVRAGVRVSVPGASCWPRKFAHLAGPPHFLARRGPLPAPGIPTVAIVGQRRATPYGREVAAWLADALARRKVGIVSGGAVGIDAAAHRAAADAGGVTVVLLGCGHDVPYPRQHAQAGGLFDDVLAAGGALLSESLPGEGPRAHRVLARNRLIAALSDVVIVVEGGARSGALNTATHASDQGIPVLAVPGDVRAAGSAAPNRLLAEGCAPCRGPDDVIAALGGLITPGGIDDGGATVGGLPLGDVLPVQAVRILASAFPRPVPVDDLARKAGIPTGTLLAVLTQARLAGLVASDAAGVRLRRRPAPDD
jgi:DNA processing protein